MTFFWSPGAASEERVTARLGREVQLCCKKFVLTLRSAVRLLTWLGTIKLDAGAGLLSSELHCPGSTRRKTQARKKQQGSGGVKQRGETWKRLRHTAPKGESGMGTRGKFFAGRMLCFSPCF